MLTEPIIRLLNFLFAAAALWTGTVMCNGINQAFPNNESYRCRFPSLILQCSFSPGPVVILWSLPENNITNIQYSAVKGLVIDNSSVGNGHSILMVSNRMFFYKGYMCAAINSDGSQEITTVQPVPFTNLTLETNSCTSLAIKWIHPYPECKRYLVIVDGAILRDNITDTNYTITGLAPSTKYNVTVVASTDDPLPVQIISEAFMTASECNKGDLAAAGHTSTDTILVAAAVVGVILLHACS